jgi:hypothetical protein
MRKKLIVAGLAGLTFVLLPAPLVTGVAEAGCTGSPVNNTLVCSCGDQAYWDGHQCQVTQDWINSHRINPRWFPGCNGYNC